MSTSLDAYRQHLLFALRERRVPSPRIGEAIAEVESHVAETGEDPVTAFGDPAEYAQRLAESLPPGTGPRGHRTTIVLAIGVFAGGALITEGLIHGRTPPAVAGLVLLAALVVWRWRPRKTDRIVDPRTGRTLRLPAPRWAVVVLAGCLLGLAVFMLAIR